MSEPFSSPLQPETRDLYSAGVKTATPALCELLRSEIRANGPLPFPDYLQRALYHPELGYYAKGADAVGKAGDFFTSVSIGPLFGQLLAERFRLWWTANDRPSRWRITELGAHDGTLAIDILTALKNLDPAAFDAASYATAEPLPALAARQKARVGMFFGEKFQTTTLDRLADEPAPGVVFGNELIDALPFHVVRREGGRWLEAKVGLDAEEALTWVHEKITDPGLADFCAELGGDFPDGYTTEVRLGLEPFLEKLAAVLDHGLLCLIDYGFPRSDYYHPDRTTGTLRTFSKHRAGEDPLEQPGDQDITAHVDFTRLMEAGIAAGLEPHLWVDQGHYLTLLGSPWLISLENATQAERAPLLRQFQTLTHPAHLGARFHVLEMLRPPTSAGFHAPLRPHPRQALR